MYRQLGLPLLPEWAQQATVHLHGDGTQSVGTLKANIVLLSPLCSFIHSMSWVCFEVM